MKNRYTIVLVSLLSFVGLNKGSAQVNLPYTLTFTSNAAASWSDGIASDGDGGTSNINGLDIEIFAATSSFTPLPGATMVWHDNNYYFSNNSAYTAITPGPDVQVTNFGIPAMVIRSSNAANNFSLESINLYDWGSIVTVTIEALNNGTSLGSVQVNLNAGAWTPVVVSQAGVLTPSIFQSVDEVRFYPDGPSEFWLSMNNISLDQPSGTLPVQWVSFNGTLSNPQTALLEWQTELEENNSHFIIEHSRDGSQYQEKGQVAAGSNSSGTNSYQYSVADLAPGKHFFRIRQVDADGRFSYSRIITLTVGAQARVSIYPNPVRNTAAVYAGGDIVQSMAVYSITGKLMERLEPASAQPLLNLTSYPAGIYFVEITTAAGRHRQRVVKE